MQGDNFTWSLFVNGFYEGLTSFKTVVVPATRTQCEALRLMLGGSSGLANGIYYNCLSGFVPAR